MKKLAAFLLCLFLLFSYALAQEPAETPIPILASFATTDLDGNEVDQTLFKDYKLTMINIWATYCNPCLSELPSLGKIHIDLSESSFQVVGLLLDAQDFDLNLVQSQVDLAKEIMTVTSVTYPQIIPNLAMYQSFLSQVRGVPCTFFVDENGNMISAAYYGAKTEEQWLDIIKPLLEQVSP